MRQAGSSSGRFAARAGRTETVSHSRTPRDRTAHRPWFVTSAVTVFSATLSLYVLAGAGNDVGPRTGLDPTPIALASPHIVILKSKHVMHLFDSETLVRSYPIDVGTAAIGCKEQQGDGRTPTGMFHIVTKNAESPYHRFLGIDYPDAAAVERGLARGLISEGEAVGIRNALGSRQCPDWGTALGGGIGIHGRRAGRDWTAGCIALSDEHVAELFSVLRIGDLVEILP